MFELYPIPLIYTEFLPYILLVTSELKSCRITLTSNKNMFVFFPQLLALATQFFCHKQTKDFINRNYCANFSSLQIYQTLFDFK